MIVRSSTSSSTIIFDRCRLDTEWKWAWDARRVRFGLQLCQRSGALMGVKVSGEHCDGGNIDLGRTARHATCAHANAPIHMTFLHSIPPFVCLLRRHADHSWSILGKHIYQYDMPNCQVGKLCCYIHCRSVTSHLSLIEAWPFWSVDPQSIIQSNSPEN